MTRYNKTRKWISPWKGKTYTEIFGKKKGQLIAKKIKDNHISHKYLFTGKCKTDELEKRRREKISSTMKNRKIGGYRQGSGRGQKGKYKGYWCDSSWELAWIIYNIDHNIKFERNTKKFEYVHNGETKYWIPDFILSDKSYVEIKGYFTDQVLSKISSFIHPLKLLTGTDMNPILSYVKSKYGENYISLYDKN